MRFRPYADEDEDRELVSPFFLGKRLTACLTIGALAAIIAFATVQTSMRYILWKIHVADHVSFWIVWRETALEDSFMALLIFLLLRFGLVK